jgi:hypothetical protein
MAKISITVDLNVTDAAYKAIKECDYDVYLLDEIADQMYTAFKETCIEKDISEHIIMLVQQFNESTVNLDEEIW